MSPSEVREDGVAIMGTVIDDPAYRAYQMRMQGRDWDTIAQSTGYASPKSAQVAVRLYTTKAAVVMDNARREEVLGLEMDRLDALQNAVWPDAMLGDTKAVDSVLRVMGHRAKLLGLELIAQGGTQVTSNTVVVQGDTQEFIRSLRLVSNPEEAGDDDSA